MRQSYKHSIDSPSSFSSSLLDAVFRSIEDAEEPPYTIGRGSTMARKSQTKFASISSDRVENYRSTKERKVESSRRKAETEAATPEKTECGDSASARSVRIEPSRGGAVSTSSGHQSPTLIRAKNLKPIRTSTDQLETTTQRSDTRRREDSRCSSKPKHNAPSPTRCLENAKSRAAKIYGELKNSKQPISPGGKMMRFITSLFSKRSSSSSNKIEKVREADQSRRTTIQAPVITTCSSASSYNRSCLSNNKSPFSAKTTSVRFCPVSIVIGDDEGHCNPKHARSCYQEQKLKFKDNDLGRENCRSQLVQSDIRELLNKYNKNGGVLDIYDKLRVEDGNGVGDDDGGSCGSSDLFELDHIVGNTNRGIHDDELPVYASTQLHNKNSGKREKMGRYLRRIV